MPNRTWHDAHLRLVDARHDSLQDTTIEYLEELKKQLKDWLELVEEDIENKMDEVTVCIERAI